MKTAEKHGELFDQPDSPSADQLKDRFHSESRYLTAVVHIPNTPCLSAAEKMTKFKDHMAHADRK
ncbi:hypothetical protein [uncultured Mailhella sp.]|uniref:hypothetical protein n=1 Tax=uncultured Mailhella sp. TaxID=1981031 RepID=UPI00320B51E1